MEKRLSLKLLLVAVVMLVASVVTVNAADPVPAKVVGVTDGDTIKAVINGVEIKIRLYGVDAPEKAQPFGQVARAQIVGGNQRDQRTKAHLALSVIAGCQGRLIGKALAFEALIDVPAQFRLGPVNVIADANPTGHGTAGLVL